MAKKTAPNKAKAAQDEELPPMTPEAAAAIDAGIADTPDPERFERQSPRQLVAKGKPAGERLYRWDHTRDVAVLAYAPGDVVREDDNDTLFGEDELAKASGSKPASVVAEIKAGTDAATRQRATGDTYDRRALEQGLETEAQQRVAQEETSARHAKPSPSERAAARGPVRAPKREA